MLPHEKSLLSVLLYDYVNTNTKLLQYFQNKRTAQRKTSDKHRNQAVQLEMEQIFHGMPYKLFSKTKYQITTVK